jgi:Ca2+/Na+ antiporter
MTPLSTPRLSRYPRTALALLALAVLIMVVLLFLNRGDLTSATLVLVAFACFVSGLFIFAFRREARISQEVAAALSRPYTMNMARILADLGVSGPARFIPAPGDDYPAPVMQYNPVSEYRPVTLTDDASFQTGQESPGVLSIPSGIPLLELLQKDRPISLPATEPELLQAMKEVHEDLLEIADRVTVTRGDEEIVVTLENFRLVSGCRKEHETSPRNCVIAPCPVCSLTGVLLAAGLQAPCMISLTEVQGQDVVLHLEMTQFGDVLDESVKARERIGGGGIDVERLR